MAKAQMKTSSTQTKAISDLLAISINKKQGIGPTKAKNLNLESETLPMVDKCGIRATSGKRTRKTSLEE